MVGGGGGGSGGKNACIDGMMRRTRGGRRGEEGLEPPQQANKKELRTQGCSKEQQAFGEGVEAALGWGEQGTRGAQKWEPAALLHDYSKNIICIREWNPNMLEIRMVTEQE